ncbi:MAG: NifB/NifX family molybdenum-iron cluster-binding protein [Candidatus Zixiibacteriota bacterium]
MKTAISVLDNEVSQHFGRCSDFVIVDIEDGEIKSKTTIPRPEMPHPEVPEYLAKKGVEALVAGGMGRRAQMLFEQNGIKPIMGAKGDVETIINKIQNNELESIGEACSGGEGHKPGDSCGHNH